MKKPKTRKKKLSRVKKRKQRGAGDPEPPAVAPTDDWGPAAPIGNSEPAPTVPPPKKTGIPTYGSKDWDDYYLNKMRRKGESMKSVKRRHARQQKRTRIRNRRIQEQGATEEERQARRAERRQKFGQVRRFVQRTGLVGNLLSSLSTVNPAFGVAGSVARMVGYGYAKAKRMPDLAASVDQVGGRSIKFNRFVEDQIGKGVRPSGSVTRDE